MLISLTIENFRGKSGNFTFGKITKLRGRNEVGKSGIKEAVCFAFAGSDSTGVRNPTHLISHGTESLRVEVSSDKGTTIARTLTKKGSQSISIVRGGVRTPVSQEQLSKALGASPHLFLSSFLPGYFMSLKEDLRQAVLNEVLPPLDRAALLAELIGGPLDEAALLMMGNMSRRPDLIAADIAKVRRSVLAQQSQINGQITMCEVMAGSVLTAPPPCDAAARIEQLGKLKDLWKDYHSRERDWAAAKSTADQARVWNASLAQERAAAEAELASIVLLPVPEMLNNFAKKTELESRFRMFPPVPAVMNLPEGDRCSTCGQVVGSKHREHVRSEMEKAQKEYEAIKQEVQVWNAELQSCIVKLSEEELAARDTSREVEAKNRVLTERINTLRLRIASLSDRAVPEVGPEPQQPAEAYDCAMHNRLQSELAAYNRAQGQYEMALRQKNEAVAKVGVLRTQAEPLVAAAAVYEKLEAAVLALPGRELSMRAEQLTINGYTFSLEGTTVTRADGIAYATLSTGAGMKADVMLCLKFNQLMGAKAPKVIFIDNADLVDGTPNMEDVQFFLAYVVSKQHTLQVEIL